MKATSLIVIVGLLTFDGTSVQAAERHFAQVWFCLERCGSDRAASLQQLADVKAHGDAITHVSMEHWDLGDGGALIDNGFSDIVSNVTQSGYLPIMMVTSVDLSRMRTLWQNPYAFITALIAGLKALGAKGVDFDFEPNAAGTEYDAATYALFLSHVTTDLNREGLSVSADIATWNDVWDFSLLGLTTTNQLSTMNTYAYHYTDFAAALNFSQTYLKPYQMVVGLEEDYSTPLPSSEVAERFALMKQLDLCRLSLWQSPVPALWWPHVVDVAQRCRK